MSIAEKLTTIAENEQKVYDAGAKSEYDKFWDDYQDNGNRQNYTYAFTGYGWTDKIFKPKYPIKLATNGAYNMFNSCKIKNLNADLIDLSAGGSAGYMFNCSSANVTEGQGITNITGTLDLTNITSIEGLFYYCFSLTNVECIKLPKSMPSTTNTFGQCKNLKEIRFDTSSGGYIGKSTSFPQSTKLSHDSLISILNALYNYSGSGKTYTLTIGTTNLAKLEATDEGLAAIAIATEKGWTLA